MWISHEDQELWLRDVGGGSLLWSSRPEAAEVWRSAGVTQPNGRLSLGKCDAFNAVPKGMHFIRYNNQKEECDELEILFEIGSKGCKKKKKETKKLGFNPELYSP